MRTTVLTWWGAGAVALATAGACSGEADNGEAGTSAQGAATQSSGPTSSTGGGGAGAQGGAGGATGSGGGGGAAGGAPGAGGAGGGPVECQTDGDCKLFSSYCETAPCACLPLPKKDPDPMCMTGMVTCLLDPCQGKTAGCLAGQCVVDGGIEGSHCQTDGDCKSGLKCCYPCGIPGCAFQCTKPLGGDCPMFP